MKIGSLFEFAINLFLHDNLSFYSAAFLVQLQFLNSLLAGNVLSVDELLGLHYALIYLHD